jgi:hypothetical protein
MTGLEETVCDETQTSMQKMSQWWHEKSVLSQKRKGGLGMINLRSQNNALLLKHLDKFYNKKEVTRLSLFRMLMTPMERCLMQQKIKALFDGEM